MLWPQQCAVDKKQASQWPVLSPCWISPGAVAVAGGWSGELWAQAATRARANWVMTAVLVFSEAAEKHGVTEPERGLGDLEGQDSGGPPGVDENSQTNGIADDRQSLSSADNLVCWRLCPHSCLS